MSVILTASGPLARATRGCRQLNRQRFRRGGRAQYIIGAVILGTVLSGCGTSNVVAPVGRASTRDNVAASAQGVYRVVQGDSMYAVAWRYALDYRDLARWNAIAEPFTIYPGQRLRVSRPAVLPQMPRPTAIARRVRAPDAAQQRPRKKIATARATPTPPASNSKGTAKAAAPSKRVSKSESQRVVRKWRWPVRGKIIGRFGTAGGKGIDIAGRRGTAIEASAPGHVVYSGSGLRGYGRLIIVKHNKRYLSAYAHNERLHVKEGDTVKGGQRIAEMGDSGAKSVRLHFEIRRDGEPVNPTRFLPE